jgi:hypothetical protein
LFVTSVVAILLAPCVSGTVARRFFFAVGLHIASVALRLVAAV